MWGFERQPSDEIRANFEIEYTVPSECARALAEGRADIGIVPVITYASIPDLVVIPRVAIAARGAVRSIFLFSRCPIEQIERVAVDSSSRTSVALTQVLLSRFFGGRRELVSMPPDLPTMLARCHAALIIGDPALVAGIRPPEGEHRLFRYDLSQLWYERTGKPFVFAVWAMRRQALEEMRPGLPVNRIFQNSRDAGLQPENLRQICCEWSRRLGLTPEEVLSYLTCSIHYELDEACLQGLELFFQYAAECQAAPPAPTLSFLP